MPAAPLPMVEANDLWFNYDERHSVLRGVSLTVSAGAWLVLLGCNGSGKTTLVKHFNGLLRGQDGSVFLEGEEIRQQPVGELARRVAYLPQNPDRLIFAESVRKEIAFGPSRQGLAGDALDARVDESMELLGLSDLAEIPPATLGYGLRRKVALASVLAQRPQLLILDEPTNGLDAGSTRLFMEVVESRHRAGATIVMITHDLALAARYASIVALMQDGKIVAQGDAHAILTDVAQLTAAGLEPLPVTQLAGRVAGELMPDFPIDLLMPDQFADALVRAMRDGAGGLESRS